MRARSAKTSAVGCVEALVSGGRRKKRWISRTDELTDGNLLWKRTLWAGPVLPAVYVLTNPEELCKEEADGANEHNGEPAQAATHDGVRVDADDGEEDGKPGGPYDGVKGHGHEVVRGDAVELGEVQRVFYVHEHGAKLDDQTGRKPNVSCEREARGFGGRGTFTRGGRAMPTRRPTTGEPYGATGGPRSCIWPQSRRRILSLEGKMRDRMRLDGRKRITLDLDEGIVDVDAHGGEGRGSGEQGVEERGFMRMRILRICCACVEDADKRTWNPGKCKLLN